MIYEIQVQFTKIDGNGNEKAIKEKYIIAESRWFGEAEAKGLSYCDGENDLDIVAIKRSKLREIINKRTSDEQNIYVAEVEDVRTNEDGEETEIVYKVALFAINMDDAYTLVKEWLTQGYDMIMLGVKKVKIKDVIW